MDCWQCQGFKIGLDQESWTNKLKEYRKAGGMVSFIYSRPKISVKFRQVLIPAPS